MNLILDYEQVIQKLNEMVISKKIKQEENIGITKYGLPIQHFSFGNGKKNIVITGATHGCEIISTDFVLKLMENIANTEKSDLLNTYKLHFIPMLNPEGYLIATSAIRKLIPRNMSLQEAEKICKDYYLEYRADDIEGKERIKQGLEPDRQSIKRHQRFFEGIDYNCIPDKYKEIKNSVKSIYEKYEDLPKYSLHIWSANADGIDIQANCKYNNKNQKIQNGEVIYKDNTRQSNIQISHPGPVNCPYDKEKGFMLTNEMIAINNFLDGFYREGTLAGYYNYHSTGGLIYQRLPIDSARIINDESILWNRTVSNYVISRLYSDKTYKDFDKKEQSKYRVLKGEEELSSSNDVLKIKYPADILIELSGMGGNPLAPYGDLNNNYANLINSNIDAFKYSLRVKELAEMVSNASYKAFKKLNKDIPYTNENVEDVYGCLDLIYDEFSKKINKMEMKTAVKGSDTNYER